METYLVRVLPKIERRLVNCEKDKKKMMIQTKYGVGFACKRKYVNEKNTNSARQTAGDIYPPSKRLKEDLFLETPAVSRLLCDPSWRKISAENLSCDYTKLYGKQEAKDLFDCCENGGLQYFTGELTKVRVYGKWHNIPRKQVAHGDANLTYRYSGVTVPAKPWTPLLDKIRNRIQEVTGQRFNFVLINRYKDGNDYMGEHRDDEKELVPTSPIASLSLGQSRDFIFRHGESRGKNAKRKLPPIKIELENGSLLMMNYPTNVHWYHSLPVRRKVLGVRINMTFRCLKA